MTTAYDYDRQCWVEGPAATALLYDQLEETVGILEGPDGQLYLDMIADLRPLADVLADCKSKMERLTCTAE